jgi:hypothetical protein
MKLKIGENISLGPSFFFRKISFPIMHLMPYYVKIGRPCP